jgi:hypothetical protein
MVSATGSTTSSITSSLGAGSSGHLPPPITPSSAAIKKFFIDNFQIDPDIASPSEVLPLYVVLPSFLKYFSTLIHKEEFPAVPTTEADEKWPIDTEVDFFNLDALDTLPCFAEGFFDTDLIPLTEPNETLKLNNLVEALKSYYPDPGFTAVRQNMAFRFSTEIDLHSVNFSAETLVFTFQYLDKSKAKYDLTLINFLCCDDSLIGPKIEPIPTTRSTDAHYQFTLGQNAVEKILAIRTQHRLIRTNEPKGLEAGIQEWTVKPSAPRLKNRLGDHRLMTVRPFDPSKTSPAKSVGNIGIFPYQEKPSIPENVKSLTSRKYSFTLSSKELKANPYNNALQNGPVIAPNDAHIIENFIYNPKAGTGGTLVRPYEHNSLEEASKYLTQTAHIFNFENLISLEAKAIKTQALTEVGARVRLNMESTTWGIMFPMSHSQRLWGLHSARMATKHLKARELALGHPWSDAYEMPIILLYDRWMRNAPPATSDDCEYFLDRKCYSKAEQQADIQNAKKIVKQKIEKGPLTFKTSEIASLIYLDYLDDPNEIFTVQSEKGSILLYDLLQEGYFEFIHHLLNKTNSPTFPSTLPELIKKIKTLPIGDVPGSFSLALDEAAKQYKPELVSVFLEVGTFITQRSKACTINALDWACRKNYFDIVKMLSASITESSPRIHQVQKNLLIDTAKKLSNKPLENALLGINEEPLANPATEALAESLTERKADLSDSESEAAKAPPKSWRGNHDPIGTCSDGSTMNFQDHPFKLKLHDSFSSRKIKTFTTSPLFSAPPVGVIPLANAGAYSRPTPVVPRPFVGFTALLSAINTPGSSTVSGGSNASKGTTAGSTPSPPIEGREPLYCRLLTAIEKKDSSQILTILTTQKSIEDLKIYLRKCGKEESLRRVKVLIHAVISSLPYQLGEDSALDFFLKKLELSLTERMGNHERTPIHHLFSTRGDGYLTIRKLFSQIPPETQLTLLTNYSEGLTALHIAVISRNTRMVDEILALAPADLDLLDLRSHDGLTPLHLAACIDYFEILRRLLVKASPSVLAAVNAKGETYQEILTRNRHYQDRLSKNPSSVAGLIPSAPRTSSVFMAGAGSSSGSSSENPKKRTQTQEESPSKSARTGSLP